MILGCDFLSLFDDFLLNQVFGIKEISVVQSQDLRPEKVAMANFTELLAQNQQHYMLTQRQAILPLVH